MTVAVRVGPTRWATAAAGTSRARSTVHRSARAINAPTPFPLEYSGTVRVSVTTGARAALDGVVARGLMAVYAGRALMGQPERPGVDDGHVGPRRPGPGRLGRRVAVGAIGRGKRRHAGRSVVRVGYGDIGGVMAPVARPCHARVR